MPFAPMDLVVTTATITSVVILALRVLVLRRGDVESRLVAGICLAVICNQILGLQEFAPFGPPDFRPRLGLFAPALNLVRNAAPGLFMIQAHRLFVDGKPLPRWLWLAIAVQLTLEAVAFASPLRRSLGAAPAALEVLFGGLALYWVLADWRDDLVEARRKARAVALALVAVNMIVPALVLRLMAPPGPWSFTLHIAISVTVAGIAALLVIVDGEGARPLEAGPARAPGRGPDPAPTSEDAATLHRLKRLMAEERVFLEPDLRLSDLAHRVGAPEYRLRRLIHADLGHRNFNAYLHAFRIEEACRRLRDPAERRTPILTIALSLGYGSINSFNRGFRTIMNCSPSEYRAGSPPAPPAPNPEIGGQKRQSDAA